MTPSVLQIALFCLLILVASGVAYYHRPAVLRGTAPGPLCANCGYSLAGHQLPEVRCPECGKKLEPEEIITQPRRGKAYLRRKLLIVVSLFILVSAGSPWLLPGYRMASVLCGALGPASRTYRQVDLQLIRSGWFFTAYVPVPRTMSTGYLNVVLRHDEEGFGSCLTVDAKTRRYAALDSSASKLSTEPIDAEALVRWMSHKGIPIHSDQVRREARYVVAYMDRMLRNDFSPPPNAPFEFAGRAIDLSAWVPDQRPVWLVCVAAGVAGVIWLLGVRRIRRKSLLVASRAAEGLQGCPPDGSA